MAEAKTSKKNKTAQTAASGFQKNIRGRTLEGAPNPVDKHVGNRIRLRRTILGYSQQFMARKLFPKFWKCRWNISLKIWMPVSPDQAR